MSTDLQTPPAGHGVTARRRRNASDLTTLSFLLDPPRSGPRSWVVFAIAMTVLFGSTFALFLPLVREAVGLSAILMMLSLIFLRVPVAVAMAVPALLGMYSLRGTRLVTSALTDLPYGEVANWTLSVVPMFIFMGLLLWRAGLTESLYDAGKQWLGWLPGGLAGGTNLAGAGLAAVSGSTIGTTYALARIGIPEMLRAGYDKRLAIGAVMVAGLPGQLIPPSILLVIYAGIAEVPVGPQLLAGVGPGILVAVLFTVMIVLMAKARPSLVGGGASVGEGEVARERIVTETSWSERGHTLVKVWPVPLLILVVVWGMFSGTFTATEAGACAAALSLIITVVWKRGNQPMRAITDAAMGTISSVGAIFFMLIGVEALARMLTLTGISTGFADLIQTMDLGRIQFLLLMMVIYLVLGTFMEPLAMMLLTVPILMPTLISLDISLLWFGVFAVFLGEIAILSPPVGILAFIIHKIVQDPEVNQGQKISLTDVFVALLWFMPMTIVVIVVLIVFPDIATFLPDRAAG